MKTFYSQEAEESFLINLMLGSYHELSRPIYQDHFQKQEHKKILQECLWLNANGKEISPIALTDRGCNQETIQKLIDGYTPFKINQCWGILEEYRLKRCVQNEANGILKRFSELKGKDVAEEIQKLSNRLTDGIILEAKQGDLGQRSREYLRKLADGGVKGMKTGIKSFDDAVGELFHGELHIIAGFPSVGKSALALQIARNMAKMKHGVRYFSLEEVEESYMKRIVASETGFPYSAYRNGLTSKQRQEQNELWQKVWGEGGSLSGLNLDLDDENDTLESIYLASAKQKNKQGLDVVIIDGATNISHRESNVFLKNEDIAQTCLRLAKRQNICVILLAHINNDTMKKDKEQKKKRPDMSSVMGGQTLIKPAFSVTVLDRVSEEFIPNQPTEIVGHLVKSRNSAPNQQIPLLFDGVKQTYTSGEKVNGVW